MDMSGGMGLDRRRVRLTLPTASAQPAWVGQARTWARRTVDRYDAPAMRQARRLIGDFRADGPDVVQFGDSMLSVVAADEPDRTKLRAMAPQEINQRRSGTRVLVIDGPSYGAHIISGFLRLMTQFEHRPIVVVPLLQRTCFSPWIEHPVYGHKDTLAMLAAIDPTAARWHIRGGRAKPEAAEFEAFMDVPHATFLGDWTVGDYVRPLLDQSRWTGLDDPERLRMLYGYHFTGRLTDDDPLVAPVEQMGRLLAQLDVPVVTYQTPIPVAFGNQLFGERFGQVVGDNYDVLERAFRRGLGRDIDVIQSGTVFSPSDSVDPTDGSEHLRADGRRRLAQMIAHGVSQIHGDH